MRFAGKAFLIAGGARGLGAAQARGLVSEGATVFIGDTRIEQGLALASELGASCRFLRLDVTQEQDWARAVEACEQMGRLAGLANNAGIFVPQSLLQTDTDTFEQHMRVNQLGTFLGMRMVAPALQRQGKGSIVNVSSAAGLRGRAHAIAYVGTKWAVRGMSKSAALELAASGIRVNSIHPGPIDTDMLKIRSHEDNQKHLAMVPLRRMGTAEEVSRLVLFLLSDESAYITGAEMAIDGGSAL